MIVPTLGYILSILINMTVIYSDALYAEFLLFASVPIGITGGFHTLMMAAQRQVVVITLVCTN